MSLLMDSHLRLQLHAAEHSDPHQASRALHYCNKSSIPCSKNGLWNGQRPVAHIRSCQAVRWAAWPRDLPLPPKKVVQKISHIKLHLHK